VQSGQFILGPEVKAFEEEMAAYSRGRLDFGTSIKAKCTECGKMHLKKAEEKIKAKGES